MTNRPHASYNCEFRLRFLRKEAAPISSRRANPIPVQSEDSPDARISTCREHGNLTSCCSKERRRGTFRARTQTTRYLGAHWKPLATLASERHLESARSGMSSE